jgi:AraC family transcriptional regulator
LRRRSVFVSPADALAPHFARLYDEYHSHHRFRRQTQRALLLLICAEALRSQDVSRADAGRVLTTAQRRLLIQFADANVATRYSPDDLSAVVGLSPDYFARLFRRSFGLPPRTWIMQHRIRQAANALLESNRTVTEVAFSLGYDDIYLFSRQFRQVMGLAPTPWRRQAGR